MKIELVHINNLEDVVKIYRGCAEYHAEKGFFQWDENYPSHKIVENDINNHQLFGLFDQNQCLGIIALTHDEPKEYQDLTWEDKSKNHIIIHRLCISKEHMRKGYAKMLMDFSENWTKNNNYSSIRLDTFSPNTAAVKFYTNLNYLIKGEVYFEKRKDDGYTCFEKVL